MEMYRESIAWPSSRNSRDGISLGGERCFCKSMPIPVCPFWKLQPGILVAAKTKCLEEVQDSKAPHNNLASRVRVDRQRTINKNIGYVLIKKFVARHTESITYLGPKKRQKYPFRMQINRGRTQITAHMTADVYSRRRHRYQMGHRTDRQRSVLMALSMLRPVM